VRRVALYFLSTVIGALCIDVTTPLSRYASICIAGFVVLVVAALDELAP
jgi:hypothetical protein